MKEYNKMALEKLCTWEFWKAVGGFILLFIACCIAVLIACYVVGHLVFILLTYF